MLHISKTDFELKDLAGDDIYDFEYFLVGEDRDYLLTFIPVSDRIGTFIVDIPGLVFKEVPGIDSEVRVLPKLIPYNTKEPKIVDYESLGVFKEGIFDVVLELDYPDVGLDADNLFYEGRDLKLLILMGFLLHFMNLSMFRRFIGLRLWM